MNWSFGLAGVGVLGLYLAGRAGWGWAVGLLAQTLWAVYAVATGQLGFLVSCVAYSIVYGLNLRRWWITRGALA